MKFYIYTLGCKVNAYESEVMKEKLLANGYIYDEEHPDIVIVNTCSVTFSKIQDCGSGLFNRK